MRATKVSEDLKQELREHIESQLEEHPFVLPVFQQKEDRIAFRFLDYRRTLYSRWSPWLEPDPEEGLSFLAVDDEIHSLLAQVTSPPN